MTFFVILLWLGGTTPAYRHAMRNGCGKFGSLFQALLWPGDVGWVLADKYCSGPHKE